MTCTHGTHIYDMSCKECCVRFVIHARPSKQRQENALASIQAHGAFTRQQIVDEIRKRETMEAMKP